MSARKVGMKVGRGLGFVAATAWGGVVVVASAAGEAGEGFVQGTSDGWGERSEHMDKVIAARTARRKLANAEREAARELNAPMVAA